ncbi:hypothetical protein DYB32_002886 [Aphanomyces invadans]|nr:hypothetical protein DYB32_002886 [Aphanomyces invadans]
MKRIAAEEGLIALAYDRSHGEYARVFQFAKLYLFAPSSAVFTCPLAMADGAARLIQGLPTKSRTLEHAYKRLLSRDPSHAWTSGQWMTERTGGSDVSRIETIAIPHQDSGRYRLHGFKWFSSATDSEMALLLARIPDSPKLSLFFARIHQDSAKSQLNGIRIQRLKPKLGTRALPTAELELYGMDAELIGTPGRGVATIATMLNITRVHTAVNAVSFFRRALAIADSYATKRAAFGRQLADLPLHKKTLWDLHTSYRLCLHLVFHTVAILGRHEAMNCGGDTSADESAASLLRVLTPLVKAWCSKASLSGIGECLEALGGAGYMEDVGLARLLRDCQAQTIWEGTTNVLALDLRKLLTSNDAKYRFAWKAFVESQLEVVPPSKSKTAVQKRVHALLDDRLRQGAMYDEFFARQVLVDMAETTASVLVLSHASTTGDALDWQFAEHAALGVYPANIIHGEKDVVVT